MSLSFLNGGNKPVNEVDRDLNQDSITSCYPKNLTEFSRRSYIYGRREAKSHESKKKKNNFEPNNKVKTVYN